MNSHFCGTVFVISCLFSGRIHAAVVSSVNLSTRSVTVEWSEKGETKGKEVIRLFFSINGIIELIFLPFVFINLV